MIVYSIIISRYPDLYPQVKKRKTITYLAKILEYIMEGDNKKAKNLSRVLMSEGNFFKGFVAYLTSLILNKKRANSLYNNKKLIKVFLDYI